MIQEVRAIFAPASFFWSDQYFRRYGLLKIYGKMLLPRENAYNLLICAQKRPNQKKNLKSYTYKCVQTLRIS